MQQTAGALQAQATATAKTAKEKAAIGVRKSASKVTKRGGTASRSTTRSGKSTSSVSDRTASNGTMPKTGGDGNRPFVPANGSYGGQGPL